MRLVVAGEAVVGQLLQRRPGGDERVELRADPGGAVERAEADPDRVAVRPVGAEEARAADRAEGLDAPVVRPEDADQVGAGEQAEAVPRDASLRPPERP